MSHALPPPAIFPAGMVINCRTRTFEELEAIAEKWNLTSYQLERGTFQAVLQAVHTPRVQLARTWRALRSFLEGRIPSGAVLISFPANARTALCSRGHALGNREAVLQHHTEELEAAIGAQSDVVTLAISEAELTRRAEILWHRPFPKGNRHGTIAFAGNLSAPQAGRRFLGLLRETLSEERAPLGAAQTHSLENLLLDELIHFFETPGFLDDSLSRHHIARRAEGYLRAHCQDELSITDLCAATGATRRTLHLGFCELYGMSPMHYLKALRLTRVRRDLISASPSFSGVTEAALRWGFCHLGRFSADYREFFGELPSVEKARADRRPRVCRRFL